jgi:hypothetical protein
MLEELFKYLAKSKCLSAHSTLSGISIEITRSQLADTHIYKKESYGWNSKNGIDPSDEPASSVPFKGKLRRY